MVLLVIWSPVLFFYFLFPATQYNVGTDYFSYRNYYSSPESIDLYYRKGELVFYYMYKAIINNQLGEQSIFYFSTLFNTILFSLMLFKLRKAGFKISIVFFLFFTVTGIYHNQMNGLRAYMGIMCFPLVFIYLAESKYIKSASFGILAILSHFSSVVCLLMIPMKLMLGLSKRKLLALFCVIPFVYASLIKFIPFVVELLFSRYAHYLNSEYATGVSLVNTFSKLYYLPIYMLFWFVYIKRKPITTYINSVLFRSYFDLSIVIWIVSYWFIILSSKYGFFFRLQSAFIVFYIFPIYYLFQYLIDKKNYLVLLLLSTYIIFPYVIKVTILSKGEYAYANYLFSSF